MQIAVTTYSLIPIESGLSSNHRIAVEVTSLHNRYMISTYCIAATILAGLLIGCAPAVEPCLTVKRADIPSISKGERLRIIQVNRMPTRYWYTAICSMSDARLSECQHKPVDGVTEEELESVDSALQGLAVGLTEAPAALCATVNIYIRN